MVGVKGHVFNSTIPELVWYGLSWPQELDAKQVNAWLQAIGGNNGSRGMRFVVIAKHGSTKYYLALPETHEKHLLQYLSSFVPGIEANKCDALDLSANVAARLHMTTKDRVLATEGIDITSHAIISALQVLDKDESIVIECILGHCTSPAIVSNKNVSTESTSVIGSVYKTLAGNNPAKLEPQEHSSMTDKRGVAAWRAAILIGVSAGNKHRRNHLFGQVIGATKSAEAPGVRLRLKPVSTKRLSVKYTPVFWPLLLNVDELTGMLAWPLGEIEATGIKRVASRQLPVPSDMPVDNPVVAMSSIAGSEAKLTLSPVDNLTHLHVLGLTGTGKSTFLENHIIQNIERGYGLAVIDPKGDLVNSLLSRIPANRQDDIVFLDPNDLEQPVGLNPLASNGQSPYLIADNILSIFHKLYGSYFGARSHDILHSTLLTLMNGKNSSICNLPALLSGGDFQNQLVSQITDPFLKTFWDWYENQSPSDRNAAVAPLMNKLRQILLRPNFRLIMGQETPKFDVTDIFSKRKILLVNLAKGNLGSEASQLFGSLVVAQLWQATLSRAKVAPEKRSPVLFVIDEVQDYLHLPTDLSDVLFQARGLGVGLVMANQNMGQFPRDLRSGIANARSRICFQLGHEDAVDMAKTTKLLTAEDFENQDKYHIYAQLMQDGKVSPWISGVTLPLPEPISKPDTIRALSRQRYGIPASDIEAEITNKLPINKPKATFGKIGRKKLDFSQQLEIQTALRTLREGGY